jgi:hypothetical protein
VAETPKIDTSEFDKHLKQPRGSTFTVILDHLDQTDPERAALVRHVLALRGGPRDSFKYSGEVIAKTLCGWGYEIGKTCVNDERHRRGL